MNPLAKQQEVSEYLNLTGKDALYAGECGTGHLRKIKQGRLVFWYWPQIEAHREAMIKHGECDGECERVFNEAGKSNEPYLRAVGG